MEYLESSNAPRAIGPYSQAVKAGGYVFCSGQIALSPDGRMTEGDIKNQTVQVLNNLKAVLHQAGLSLEQVVKVTVFLKDIKLFNDMNEVYGQFFSINKPARSTVEVAALPKEALIEIDCIAIANEG